MRSSIRAPRHSSTEQIVVAGVPLSHPHRLLYPEPRVSKLDLARYYMQIERWILPHVVGRPLTLMHCPGSVLEPCRYLRHAKAWGPSALRRVRIREKKKVGEYLVADSISGVVALAQMGVVEIHTWNSTIETVERPNRILWDLDPGPFVTRNDLNAAALLLRQVLDTLGLTSWLKTTGGKGLHIVVPIEPSLNWSDCLAFSRHVAEALVRTNPRLFTTSFAKEGRQAQILIDYLRNNRTNTSICAYSPRARAGAPVSVPVAWAELRADQKQWSLLTLPRRLKRLHTDPWREYWTTSQTVVPAALDAVRRI